MSPHAQSAAVVVGVDHYPDPAIANLRGAVADARAMARLLVEHFGFSPDRVVTLLDGRATAARIEESVDWLERTVGPEGAAVFFFAGHGAQRFDDSGDESDDFDETFVPHDSGRGPRPDRDLSDDWVRTRLDRLAARAASVTAIFDCCHSGTMGREIADGATGVRRTEPARGPRRPRGPRLRRAGGEAPYVLLAAAAADEAAHEKTVGQKPQGVFTRALIAALAASTAGDSWRTIIARVRAAVRDADSEQTPQLEGALSDRRPFSTARPDTPWALAEPDGEGIVVALGRLHGVSAGTVLSMDPIEGGKGPLKARVIDLGPFSCRCVPLDGATAHGPLRATLPPGRPSLWDLTSDETLAADPFELVFDGSGLVDDDGAQVVYAGDALTLTFDNTGNRRVHIALVAIDVDGAVQLLVPEEGGDMQISPFGRHTEIFDAELPRDRPGGYRWRLVLVASTAWFDARLLAGSARGVIPPIKNLLLALYPLVVRVLPAPEP